MMMKHSRWSGRRLMPSGGGWMTPNPSGGVAACLVWNTRQTTTAAAATLHSNAGDDDAEQQQKPRRAQKPATYGDVNV